MVNTIPDSNFVRKLNGSNCFSCVNCYDQYDDLGGKNRQTTTSSGIEKGWVRYEYAPGKGNHAALYVGGDQYAHGNWSDAVHVTASSGMGTLKGFGKPYYRSKVYYNTNQTGASFNGYTYPNIYSTWYTEETAFPLASSGPTCSGKTFEGWHTTSACTTKITSIPANERGAQTVYAKWSGGSITVTPTPTQPYGIDRRGHSFEGWYKNSSFTGPSYTNLPKGTIGEQSFYAKWEPLVYDLILHKNGGTCVNPRIDDGIVVGDDIIGTYTYAKGSTFPKANDDVYKKDRIFAGWYDNSILSGTPQTGIRSGDDDTAPIGDKEYWARWLGIIPNTSANDATEVVNNELLLYVYYTYRIDTDESGNVIQRVSTPTAENKRHFSVDLKIDTNPGTTSAVKVWLSKSKDPKNTSDRLNWAVTSTKSKSMSGAVMNTYDNSTIKYTCPSDIENFIGGSGSRRVYVHVETVTGNTGTHTINLIKRALYKQH